MSEVERRMWLDGGDLKVAYQQDVEPILDHNAMLRSQPQKSDWGRHIAQIPNIVMLQWMNEEGANVFKMSSEEFGAFIRRKLNDPDWRHLRVDK